MQAFEICEVEKYQPMKTFLTNYAKNSKGRHSMVNRHRSFKLPSKFEILL